MVRRTGGIEAAAPDRIVYSSGEMSDQDTKTPSGEERAPEQAAAEPSAESPIDAPSEPRVEPNAESAEGAPEPVTESATAPEPDAAAAEVPASASDGTAEADAGAEAESSAESGTEDPPASEADERTKMMAQISSLEADLVKLEHEKQDNWNRFLRATADVENVRRRAKRDVEDARTDARTKVLKEMLPVIDNLERALDHAEKSAADKGGDDKAGDDRASQDGGIIEGVKLVLRQFSQALERSGVTPVAAQGEPFDPTVHEAISQIETADAPAGSVVQALQKGYKIGNRLLRPALVVVAKAPPEADPAPAEGDGQDAGESNAGEQGAAAEAEAE